MIKNELIRQRVLRLGAILGNYAVCGGVLLFVLGIMPAVTFMFILGALCVYAVLILLWLVTLGQLFTFPDTSLLDVTSGPIYEGIVRIAHTCAPYLFTIAAVGAAISLTIVIIDKKPHTGRIVACSIGLAFAVIGMILVYTTGAAL